jgi:hypothetical protein
MDFRVHYTALLRTKYHITNVQYFRQMHQHTKLQNSTLSGTSFAHKYEASKSVMWALLFDSGKAK